MKLFPFMKKKKKSSIMKLKDKACIEKYSIYLDDNTNIKIIFV